MSRHATLLRPKARACIVCVSCCTPVAREATDDDGSSCVLFVIILMIRIRIIFIIV